MAKLNYGSTEICGPEIVKPALTNSRLVSAYAYKTAPFYMELEATFKPSINEYNKAEALIPEFQTEAVYNRDGDVLLDATMLRAQLIYQSTYTISFTVECTAIPDGVLSSDTIGFEWVTKRHSKTIPCYVNHVLQVGEVQRFALTFTYDSTIQSIIDNYGLVVRNNAYNTENGVEYASIIFSDIQLECGSVASDYVAYKPIVYPSLTWNGTIINLNYPLLNRRSTAHKYCDVLRVHYRAGNITCLHKATSGSSRVTYISANNDICNALLPLTVTPNGRYTARNCYIRLQYYQPKV